MRYLILLSILISTTAKSQINTYGRTTGRLPYLEYGLGDDRLGGAKMGYLDTNILVHVVDSTSNDYKVQLSANHAAYLPKSNFKEDTSIKVQPYYLTSSWRVYGDDKYDYVTIALPERLPYSSQVELCPNILMVDIYGATSNTNWITQLKTVKEIHHVWYEQKENDVFRVYIRLKNEKNWGHFIYYVKNVLHIRIKRQPSSNIKDLVIAIDAGHGGSNNGASGITSKALEKEYTLKIAKALEEKLQKKGVTVFMTRTEDIDVGMIDRTLMLRERDPDLMISIHLNSSSNRNAQGVSTYYRYLAFRPLSQYILDRMLELKLNNFGNIGGFNFSLSGPTEYPNCLVEVAFLSNEEDEKRILDERFHKDVAEKIYEGIRDWMRSR
jgi:N-acetylmuramoyl-L-alanine amidase